MFRNRHAFNVFKGVHVPSTSLAIIAAGIPFRKVLAPTQALAQMIIQLIRTRSVSRELTQIITHPAQGLELAALDDWEH